jgi:hypothetical protein
VRCSLFLEFSKGCRQKLSHSRFCLTRFAGMGFCGLLGAGIAGWKGSQYCGGLALARGPRSIEI